MPNQGHENVKVLLVDDDIFILASVQTYLEKNNYDVVTCSNGQEAMEAIEKKRPDVVLCDRSMPKMTGFQLLEKIRQSDCSFRDLPFIFLTALSDNRDIHATATLKPDAYLAKPVDFSELQETIQGVLKRAA